ncbi:hypothetical protein [Streptomyces albus]|uniref:Uncharacterized protein n=1 Tax=Streptomyces albus TaxID=1888 RepID=A0A8H1L587_9ACTN|nr:hypothetical protein [Streptomyces albus]TGG78464.1 hypothetical protein D8771_25020 [Streptomyces albus]UVN59457.1 hypothetical protein NR995_33530 [Streptomyces albus]
MNEAMIGLITGLLAALVALGTTIWTDVRAERRQELSQRAQWTHDRRRDAYLAFSKAARAFVPLSEGLFLLFERANAANATTTTPELEPDADGIRWVLYETWHETLLSGELAEPGWQWKEAAPELLQDLTTAYDGVELEGPPEIAQVAYTVVAMAQRLLVGMPLFEMEEKEQAEIDEDGRRAGPDAWTLLREDVRAYFEAFYEFRREARALLEQSG